MITPEPSALTPHQRWPQTALKSSPALMEALAEWAWTQRTTPAGLYRAALEALAERAAATGDQAAAALLEQSRIAYSRRQWAHVVEKARLLQPEAS